MHLSCSHAAPRGSESWVSLWVWAQTPTTSQTRGRMTKPHSKHPSLFPPTFLSLHYFWLQLSEESCYKTHTHKKKTTNKPKALQ